MHELTTRLLDTEESLWIPEDGITEVGRCKTTEEMLRGNTISREMFDIIDTAKPEFHPFFFDKKKDKAETPIRFSRLQLLVMDGLLEVVDDMLHEYGINAAEKGHDNGDAEYCRLYVRIDMYRFARLIFGDDVEIDKPTVSSLESAVDELEEVGVSYSGDKGRITTHALCDMGKLTSKDSGLVLVCFTISDTFMYARHEIVESMKKFQQDIGQGL